MRRQRRKLQKSQRPRDFRTLPNTEWIIFFLFTSLVLIGLHNRSPMLMNSTKVRREKEETNRHSKWKRKRTTTTATSTCQRNAIYFSRSFHVRFLNQFSIPSCININSLHIFKYYHQYPFWYRCIPSEYITFPNDALWICMIFSESYTETYAQQRDNQVRSLVWLCYHLFLFSDGRSQIYGTEFSYFDFEFLYWC